MATISFVNRQGMAKPNMGVRVMVRVARAPQALAVPVGAVQRDRKGHVYVQVRRGDRWVRQTVRTGLADGLYVVVAEGVEGGGVVRVVGRGNLIEQA